MAKKAFLVGINDYAPAGPGGSDLRGCVNDARDMGNTLVICGFPPANIRLCTDRRATKANILDGLRRLIAGATAGDSLVFYYSGHGSQVADITGEEVDRQAEILCPHDINFAAGVYITDDELRGIMRQLPAGVNLEVLFDSCHSGTGTREVIALRELPTGVGAAVTPPDPALQYLGIRYLPPPVDFTFHMDYQPDLPTERLLKAPPGPPPGAREAVLVPGLNHTLWAGCRDNQTSQETTIEGMVRGVFTYHLCQILRRTRGNITRRALDGIVTAAIRRAGFAQVPQLESAAAEMLDKPFL